MRVEAMTARPGRAVTALLAVTALGFGVASMPSLPRTSTATALMMLVALLSGVLGLGTD